MAWGKEECRRYYRALKEKLKDLRDNYVSPPGQPRRMMRPSECKTWTQAAERFWQMLNEEGAACLPALEAEEGPLSESPKGVKGDLADAKHRLQEDRRKRQERMARTEAEPKAQQAEANAYRDFMWARITQEETPGAAIAKLAEYAAEDAEARQATIWQEVGRLDWEPAVQKMSQWMAEAINKLGQAADADLVTINLGESTEIFAVDGLPWPDGQKRMGELVKALRDAPNDWQKEVDWDKSRKLSYKKTDTLPGEVWKLVSTCDEEPRINWLAGMLIWDVVARLGLGRALRQKGVDWSGLLGKRKRVAMVLGHEEPDYIGSLTAQGWDKTR